MGNYCSCDRFRHTLIAHEPTSVLPDNRICSGKANELSWIHGITGIQCLRSYGNRYVAHHSNRANNLSARTTQAPKSGSLNHSVVRNFCHRCEHDPTSTQLAKGLPTHNRGSGLKYYGVLCHDDIGVRYSYHMCKRSNDTPLPVQDQGLIQAGDPPTTPKCNQLQSYNGGKLPRISLEWASTIVRAALAKSSKVKLPTVERFYSQLLWKYSSSNPSTTPSLAGRLTDECR
jgi:hypothetical protein